MSEARLKPYAVVWFIKLIYSLLTGCIIITSVMIPTITQPFCENTQQPPNFES